MKAMDGRACPIMVIGQDKLAYSIVSNLLIGGHAALLLTTDQQGAEEAIYNSEVPCKNLCILTEWPEEIQSTLVVLVTTDEAEVKRELIGQVEGRCAAHTIIAVNLESVSLDELQTGTQHKNRVLGLNWTYPVYRNFFAEIICNDHTDPIALEQLTDWLKTYWRKDPCVAKTGFSVRARLMAAMLREGLYLVENDFASIESVDRACRNDAGYYLPFAGNFRYMDLMGTYAYGMVMKDLNKELSNMDTLPGILQEKQRNGEVGMDAGKGFYTYSAEEKAYWQAIFDGFSQEIQQLISKYPHEPTDY